MTTPNAFTPRHSYRRAVPLLFKCGERAQSERCKSLVILADAREALRLADVALEQHRFKVLQASPRRSCAHARAEMERFGIQRGSCL